jgi:hypothetical protein
MRDFLAEFDHVVVGMDQIIQHNPFLSGGGIVLHRLPGQGPGKLL